MAKKTKKETKLQELERRIKALEAVSHQQYIGPCPYPHYPPYQIPGSGIQPPPSWQPPTVIC